MRTLVKILAGLAVLVALAVLITLIRPDPAPSIPIPSPNGYDDFVAVADLLVSESSPEKTASLEKMRIRVSQNAEALNQARLGLTRQSRIPLEYSKEYMSGHLPQLAKFKALAQAFAAEGKLAELENRPSEALRSYLDGVRFAHESLRGGVLIDSLVAMACEAICLKPVAGLMKSLNGKQCQEAAQALGAIDERSESWEAVSTQERTWSRRVYGWKGRLALVLQSLNPRAGLRAGMARAEQRLHQNQAQRRSVTTDLAVRAFELAKGRKPETLNELVPEYLKTVPVDSVQAKPDSQPK